MSKLEGHRNRLEPPKRDYAPVKRESRSLWQRLFGKRVESHKQARTVATQPKHHVSDAEGRQTQGGGDRAAPALAPRTVADSIAANMSRRSALAGLVGAAAAAPAAVHALNEHNAMRHARELAAINDYNVRMQNVFGVANVRSMPPPPIVTTYANPQSVVVTSPFHSLGHTSFLNVPGAQLPNGVTAGDVIKFQGKDWLVLDGGRNPVTGEYSLQARAV